MCGRFTQLYSWEELVAFYRVHDKVAAPNLEQRYNICPTQTVDVIVQDAEGGGLVRESMRWGLVPSWWKKSLRELPSTFNARAESVHEKPMFRTAFKTRRCLVPMSGFYEWTGEKSARQPWYITSAAGHPLTVAGLWDSWTDRETGEEIRSCTMVITSHNAWMRRIHDRMPVLLAEKDWSAWLSEPRKDLLVPAPEDALQAWPVSPRVNSNRYHEPDAIEPLAVA